MVAETKANRSYYPNVVETALLMLGKPAEHEDGSPFMKDELRARQVDMTLFACQIVVKMDPYMWTYHYDADNKRDATVTFLAVDFGRPSQLFAGGFNSAGPTSSTPAAPIPSRVRLEDGDISQQLEGAAQAAKNPSNPHSSGQGTAANPPVADEAAAKDSST